MKSFPVDYSNEELIEEISKLVTSLSETMAPGERSSVQTKIDIGQAFLNMKINRKTNSELQSIIRNNRITSILSIFLSLIMLLIAFFSLKTNRSSDLKNGFDRVNDSVTELNNNFNIMNSNINTGSDKIYNSLKELNNSFKEAENSDTTKINK